jgi:hypothetical protein
LSIRVNPVEIQKLIDSYKLTIPGKSGGRKKKHGGTNRYEFECINGAEGIVMGRQNPLI